MTPDDLRTLAELRRVRQARRNGVPLAGKRLTNLELGEVSIVDIPANQGAAHLFNKRLDDIGKADELALSPAAVAALVREVVGEKLAEISAGLARAEATAQRVTGARGGGGSAGAAPAATVAEAVRAARAAEDHPPAFWRAALRSLGELEAPDATPTEQQHAALRHPDGRMLLEALTGGRVR
jgi:hypothetical protein